MRATTPLQHFQLMPGSSSWRLLFEGFRCAFSKLHPSEEFLVISDPKAPGIIRFTYADEVLRRDTGCHTSPLGADIAAAARISFPAHPHSVVAAHWPIAAERDNKKEFGP